jgi:hypothetical protein
MVGSLAPGHARSIRGRELGKLSSRPAQYTCICEPDTPYLMTVSSPPVVCVRRYFHIPDMVLQYPGTKKIERVGHAPY